MLQITIPDTELWNELTQEFIYVKKQNIKLEHSLVSLSKWESKWCKVFFSKKEEKTHEEVLDYIRCMTLTPGVDPVMYKCLSSDNIKKINDYIEAPMSATTFHDIQTRNENREQITSELIYYWMIALNIPFECQKWHLNRLLTLIRVCEIKSQPSKKMNKNEILKSYSELNAIRKRKYGTKG